MTKNETLRCSFCGRTGDEVRKLVAGPNVYICDECVEVCQNIIDEELGHSDEAGFCIKCMYLRLMKLRLIWMNM